MVFTMTFQKAIVQSWEPRFIAQSYSLEKGVSKRDKTVFNFRNHFPQCDRIWFCSGVTERNRAVLRIASRIAIGLENGIFQIGNCGKAFSECICTDLRMAFQDATAQYLLERNRTVPRMAFPDAIAWTLFRTAFQDAIPRSWERLFRAHSYDICSWCFPVRLLWTLWHGLEEGF